MAFNGNVSRIFFFSLFLSRLLFVRTGIAELVKASRVSKAFCVLGSMGKGIVYPMVFPEIEPKKPKKERGSAI